VLNSSTNYTLALTGVNITGKIGLLNQNEIYWTYYTSSAAGGDYNVIKAGRMLVPSGTGSIGTISPDSPGIGLSFDMNATAIPEPATLLTGTLAVLAGGIFVFYKRLFL
jgi:hypothetical protein